MTEFNVPNKCLLEIPNFSNSAIGIINFDRLFHYFIADTMNALPFQNRIDNSLESSKR